MMRRNAFTLIELLVVIAILSMLSGMLSVVMATAQRSARKVNTQALLKQVSVGLHQFHDEVGTFPFHAHPSTALETNRLAAVLAWRPSDAERLSYTGALQADLAQIDAAYTTTPHAFDRSDFRNNEGDTVTTSGDLAAGLMNRFARERARISYLSGNLGVTGVIYPHRANPTALSASRLLATTGAMGWRGDYLSQDLRAEDMVGDAIVDAYGQSIHYVCPNIPAVRGIHQPTSTASGAAYKLRTVDPRIYGMGSIHRSLTSDLASDRRFTASAGFAATFELWSAGPDKNTDAMRDASSTRDDIQAEAYDAELE